MRAYGGSPDRVRDPGPLRALLGGLAVWAVTAGLLIWCSGQLSIVWDEGYTLGRQERVRQWFQALRDPAGFAEAFVPPLREYVQPDVPPSAPPRPDQMDTRAKLFDRDVLLYFWPFAREEPHGHGSVYAVIGLAGDVIAPGWEPLARARLGPILLFSCVGGWIFAVFWRRFGMTPAVAATSAWFLQPRLFAEAQFATYDGILVSLWIAAILAFTRAVRCFDGEEGEAEENTKAKANADPRWGSVVLFGCLLGTAAANKFTGMFLAGPFLVWCCLFPSRRAWLTLIGGVMISVPVMTAWHPFWWSHPIEGVTRYIQSNLTRAKTINIPVLFLGTKYLTPKDSLPWYNTLVLTAMVTPVTILVLALGGALGSVRRWRGGSWGVLVAGHWAFFLLIRALPHTPGHDGVRQFLGGFGCMALLAGLAVAGLQRISFRWAVIVTGALVTEGVVVIAAMMPVPLSYYSPLVGGLPGATRLGMEPTYYWDALTPEALDFLNTHTKDDECVVFATNPTTWRYLQDVGRLRVATYAPGRRERPAWYVLQNRAGALEPADRQRIRNSRPALTVSKFGTPLLWIFPLEP